ncbi:type II toxin-antitoxin system RelE/ParE family toxin [Streptomyces sp. TRM68367]|uniref:type II toxin-antitoxin system RelE family toxin n=1 Tax=Streptomyces sp. TRM68367 TaxID=2758415 RepID=UPI00165B7946|nr:type II toxin-antitoxin system RelE/ParE family toxin [Streptomyces sp. TRM68367]MBC9726733.1 type II toxin-antitoxin system RelE/ParE family toxin [Streptomyces sp. TRM68367]
MTWEVQWEPAALNEATGYLKDEPQGVDGLLRAADQLTENPRPEGSRAWGADHRRLHHGPWRILYRMDQDARVIHIEHIGRTVS